MVDMNPRTVSEHPRETVVHEIDLREYIRAAWRYRLAILAVSLLCAAGALGAALLAPRSYEARAVLALNPSRVAWNTALVPQSLRKLGEQGVDVGVPFPHVTTETTGLTTARYRPILESPSVAARVIRELQLDRRGFSATNLFGSLVRIEEVGNSTVFLLKVQLEDPGLAAQVANRTAELAVENRSQLMQNAALRSRDDFKAQLEDAQVRMQEAAKQLQAFKATSQVEFLRDATRRSVNSSDAARQKSLSELYHSESELSRLQVEADLTSRIYEQVATAYQTASLQAGVHTPDLQLIELAVTPDLPVPRYALRNTLLALALGLLLSAAAAMAYEAIRPSETSIA
jgi:uncharacterized protein involved in exopolysaccharide biosynthesis